VGALRPWHILTLFVCLTVMGSIVFGIVKLATRKPPQPPQPPR
jgi:hypothetical protein